MEDILYPAVEDCRLICNFRRRGRRLLSSPSPPLASDLKRCLKCPLTNPHAPQQKPLPSPSKPPRQRRYILLAMTRRHQRLLYCGHFFAYRQLQSGFGGGGQGDGQVFAV